MPAPVEPEVVRRIQECARQGMGQRAAARKLSLPRTTVQNHWPRDGSADPPDGTAAREFKEAADGTATVSVRTDAPVRTLEEAVRAAGVDAAVWYVERWEHTSWTVPVRVRRGQEPVDLATSDGKKYSALRQRPDKPIQTQQHGVKLYLRRILTRSIDAALDAVFERFRGAAPRWPKLDRPRPGRAEPFLAVVCLFDLHFGKLAWSKETGENYDLATAEGVLSNAVRDLVAECAHRPVSKILLPMGNDWLHIDSRANQTTRGTPQDVDGRFSKVFAVATAAAVWAVEAMAAVAPVQVELVPGNHDRTLSECLCHVLAARFHHTDRVAVGLEPRTRKYVRFGTNLIGLTHGDLVRPDKLPQLMPADAKRDWAETTCHEWLTGHGHRSQKWTTLDTDTQTGTVVRQLRALTRTDLWHFDHGYVGAAPAAEAYFYGFERGYAGHAVVPARTA